MEFIRGFIGIISILGIAFLFSSDRRGIDWRLVLIGVCLQLSFSVAVLKIDFFFSIFNFFSLFFVKVLEFTEHGTQFLFGNLVDPAHQNTFGMIFAFRVLPTIIFFSALTSGLYYLGVLQKIVYAIAWVMVRTMRLSGPEGLSAAGNIFLGQTEAPLLIKPFIKSLTTSQLFCVMTGGMATIAGGVMSAYISFLGGNDPTLRHFYATHFLAASMMAAPASIVIAKLLVPERKTTFINKNMDMSEVERPGANVVDAVALGAIDGLKLAAIVGGMLIAFIAVIAMLNFTLQNVVAEGIGWVMTTLGAEQGLNEWIKSFTDGRFEGLSLQFLLGMILRPIAFLIGVEWQDTIIIAGLLGEKIAINEFIAYSSLGKLAPGAISEHSKIIATYALCGFANFSSVAIQIGGIGSLATEQRANVSRLGLKAVLGGTLSTLLTASIAGMFA